MFARYRKACVFVRLLLTRVRDGAPSVRQASLSCYVDLFCFFDVNALFSEVTTDCFKTRTLGNFNVRVETGENMFSLVCSDAWPQLFHFWKCGKYITCSATSLRSTQR